MSSLVSFILLAVSLDLRLKVANKGFLHTQGQITLYELLGMAEFETIGQVYQLSAVQYWMLKALMLP